MARHIDRKLRATAAVLGLVTRKDLAAAFRRVNAATSFDIERAHKWLQGRSSPRDARLYQDWVLVLDIDQSAEWIATVLTVEVTRALVVHCPTPVAVECAACDERSAPRFLNPHAQLDLRSRVAMSIFARLSLAKA